MSIKKGFIAAIAFVMVCAVALTGCGGAGGANTAGGNAPTGTLVLGETQFNGVFSPFFSTSTYDANVYDKLVCESLLSLDRTAELTDNVCVYQPPETFDENNDGVIDKSVYTFTIKDGVKYSDGTKPVSDDIIFAIKVFCDPAYDGMSTISSLPILGVNEYRFDDPDAAARLAEIDEKAAAFDPAAAPDEVVALAAQLLADSNGMAVEDFMPGSENYESSTVAVLPIAYQQMLLGEYTEESMAKGGNRVPEISGVERVDDKTVKVTMDGIDTSAIWSLGGIDLVPRSYYGADNFKKGDLTAVKAVSGSPMGSGPYKFVSYENNVVSLEANPEYWGGAPKNAKVKFQVVDGANKLENVKLGDCDISDPAANEENVKAAEEAGLEYRLVENLGYGYVGINAERIPDKNVRKGLMSLLDRQTAVDAYYGDFAEVIERPLSTASWAYPKDAKPYYNYSVDDAKKYFEAAGYALDADGKLVKDGKQLSVEIWADGLSDHPANPMLTQLKTNLETLGAELIIQDVSPSVLNDRIGAGSMDMWCAAWQTPVDPNLYSNYNSEGNVYGLKNAELDEVLLAANNTLDIEKRKELFSKGLDMIMEEAVEMPFYQRKNMYVFNPNNIDMSSLPEDMTYFYNWKDEVQNIVMKGQ